MLGARYYFLFSIFYSRAMITGIEPERDENDCACV